MQPIALNSKRFFSWQS